MKTKIKDFFSFIARAWSGGFRGKIGIFAALFACFMFIRIFFGGVTIQGFIINIWRLNSEQQQLARERDALDTINRHIELLQNYSPDYVQEIGLKYLNIGDADIKILKI